MGENVHVVSLTAQWMAAARALESRRGDGRLFVDRFAHDLALPHGYELLERYKGGGVCDFIAIRTRYFDDAVTAAAETEGIRQIVLVAAGMDTRAYRLRWPSGTSIFEIDHAELLAEKARRLAALDAASSATRVDVPADLSVAWRHRLLNAGFDPAKRTAWIVEGLVFYLSPDQVGTLLQELRALSAIGSWLLTDMPSRTLLESPLGRPFLSALAADGVPWIFGSDEPMDFLKSTGWTSTEVRQPGEEGAGAGRWPYPVPPAGVKGIPRTWLLKATT
uniref:class I SAM-dependent methyltransferase n=1 Tax=Azospirillum argentinense TaxID=2970906 RepID=UPI001FFFD6FA|nr:SAM-dependent methyltransferase [Azospirillum argentinense]